MDAPLIEGWLKGGAGGSQVNVLIIGFACSPRLGGEPSNAWNWAWQLSRCHRVWLLAHPHDRKGIEQFLAAHPNPTLSTQWVGFPRMLDDPRLRRNNLFLAIHYQMWLRVAHKEAIKLHRKVGFDVVHHVSYGTVSAPPPFWRLPVPFVWGPVGGAQHVPSSFHRYFGHLSTREILRSIRVATLPLSLSLHRAARSSALVLATNHETANFLSRAGGRNVRLFLDSGIPSSFISGRSVPTPRDRPFTLLWVGRMERRKALTLALEAFAQNQDLNANLLIAGDGEMRTQWEQYARRLHPANKVEFLGHVPWNEMARLYERADAFVFTSLRDSFGTQVLEAMGHGLPILTLDHQGVGTFVPQDAGIKVPVTFPEQTLAGLAEGIRRLALFHEERRKMGEAALAFAKTQTWERRAACMSKLYEEVLSGPIHREVKSRFISPTFNVLGVRTHAVQIGLVIDRMQEWIRERNGGHSIAATSMHGIVEAQHDPSFKEVLNETDLVVPDGMPLVWLGRREGHLLRRRVYGPDLLLAFCAESAGRNCRHFFYGGEPGVAERLAESLKTRFPGLNVVGTCSPPFRPLTAQEDAEIVGTIGRASPDVLWVGLGAPKQERWMHEHKDRLRVPVLVGVGAAFDLLSGKRKQAPCWVREHGFEWFFRLLQEPRRLWRRYLVYGAQFIAYVALESLRLKDFGAGGMRTPNPVSRKESSA
jgi:exopolysaccharide biosynthesis WecB/TagA/CpsF family protein